MDGPFNTLIIALRIVSLIKKNNTQLNNKRLKRHANNMFHGEGYFTLR